MFIKKIYYVLALILCVCLIKDVTATDTVSCSDWTQLIPLINPPPRYYASMAYDADSKQLILFGGTNDDSPLQDTWNWNGSDWINLNPSNPPSARFAASMAYDPVSKRLILFGGTPDFRNMLNDTWSWDGSQWTQLSPSTSPSVRFGASMALDSTGHLILFGGRDNTNFTILNDTWRWDGSNWIQLFPTSSPPPLFFASMAFDPINQQMILFGGISDSISASNQTWSWDGTNWTQLFPSTSPPARDAASMAFDPNINRLVLFGGEIDLQDTWVWDGTNWTQLFPNNVPNARMAASMDFDIDKGQLILFGGTNYDEMIFNDTWDFTALLFTATPSNQTICNGSATSIALRSNIEGTTFNWIVVENGVTGASNGDGPLIAQTLTTTTSNSGTAIYTITPTTPSDCTGQPITITVIVNPTLNIIATPSSEIICSGSSTSITLSSNIEDTRFSWTVVENGVTGASNGSGPLIAQTLTTTTHAPGIATYTITATPIDCPDKSITLTVPVKVNPTPNVIATPSKQRICSGHKTSIALTSNMRGTTFSWTVKEKGVKGASNGSGTQITQTLKTTTDATGTATYTITPLLADGCLGTPITVVVKVEPCPHSPTHFHGKVKSNKFATQTDIVHILSWEPSHDSDVVGYKIFQNHELIKIIQSRNANKLRLHNRKEGRVYHYEIVAFTTSGKESDPQKLSLPHEK